MTCVLASEVDRHCRDTYRLNFGTRPRGDVRHLVLGQVPRHDILTAGFPCQPFSSAGRRRGLADARGGAFFDILRVVAACQPEVVVLENVKALLHHARGKTFRTMVSALARTGYAASWRVLNANSFGLAQHRERLMVVACRRRKFDWSRLGTNGVGCKIEDIVVERPARPTLPASSYVLLRAPITQPKSGLRFAGYRVAGTRWSRGSGGRSLNTSSAHRQTYRIYSSQGTHPTLSATGGPNRPFVLHKGIVTWLNAVERRRLMGFPDAFRISGGKTAVDRQLGNAVAVPMVRQLGREIARQLFPGRVRLEL